MQRLTERLAANLKRFLRLLAFFGIIFAVIILSVEILLKVKPITVVSGPATIIGLPDSDTVITQIRQMGRFETVSYTLEKVIPYDQDANSFWHFLGDHTKLFVVHGEVIAGFDLTKLSKKDMQIQETTKTISINLPAPQILETILDEEKTQVYESNTGLYGIWNEGLDANTEVQILGAAKRSLRDDACKGNILQQASESARQELSSFLISVGFQHVTITIPDGTC